MDITLTFCGSPTTEHQYSRKIFFSRNVFLYRYFQRNPFSCVFVICVRLLPRVSLFQWDHLVKTKPSFGFPVLGVEPKRGWFVFWLFFNIGLCSAISFKGLGESFPLAEHRSMLNDYRSTPYLCFSFMPKTGIAFHKTGVLSLLWHLFSFSHHLPPWVFLQSI